MLVLRSEFGIIIKYSCRLAFNQINRSSLESNQKQCIGTAVLYFYARHQIRTCPFKSWNYVRHSHCCWYSFNETPLWTCIFFFVFWILWSHLEVFGHALKLDLWPPPPLVQYAFLKVSYDVSINVNIFWVTFFLFGSWDTLICFSRKFQSLRPSCRFLDNYVRLSNYIVSLL